MDDLKSQREALTEDVDGSGGESEEQQAANLEAGTKGKPKGGKLVLRDSYKACLMITALLGMFAALALIALSVVSAAFDPERLARAAAAANLSSSSDHS